MSPATEHLEPQSGLARHPKSAEAGSPPVWKQAILVTAFSLVYFASTLFRASQKPFWFDELFTVYLSRLKETSALWTALKHGADLNPLVLYILTRLSDSLFGEGPIATRLPEIFGFWVFSLCLFCFVSRRASLRAATFAMLFPMTTSVYFYAYDARAHGIVLGLGGLAMVCWQAAVSGTRTKWWILGLSLSLCAAVLTHTFALLWLVPFAIAEVFRFASDRRVRIGLWLAIALPVSGIASSLPLFQVSKSTIPGVFPATLSSLSEFYISALAPAFNLLVLAFVIFMAPRSDETVSAVRPERAFPLPERVLLLCLAVMPAFEFVLALSTGAPMVNRYSISLVAGFACLISQCLTGRRRLANWMLILTTGQIALSLLRFSVSAELTEPTTTVSLLTFEQLTRTYSQLRALPDPKGKIVLLDSLEFLPLFYYAPAELSSRLTYSALAAEVNGQGYVRLQQCCRATAAHFEALDQLLSSREDFVALATPRTSDKLNYLRRAGAEIRILSILPGRFVVWVSFGAQRARAAG